VLRKHLADMAAILAEHGSFLNLLADIPELLPRSQRKATKAQQGKFEQHCRLLHREDQETSFDMAVSDFASVTSTLEEMFPHLDKMLIQSLQMEAGTEREAVEVLLALSAAIQPGTTSLQKPRSLGIENHVSFPSLIDADGWQVLCKRSEEDLGTAWCGRAKAAVDKRVPKAVAKPAIMKQAGSGRRRRKVAEVEDTAQEPHFFTDYEYRHEMGWRRAQTRRAWNRRQCGRVVAALAGLPDQRAATEREDQAMPTDAFRGGFAVGPASGSVLDSDSNSEDVEDGALNTAVRT